jgi:hypothetical protein
MNINNRVGYYLVGAQCIARIADVSAKGFSIRFQGRYIGAYGNSGYFVKGHNGEDDALPEKKRLRVVQSRRRENHR